MSSVCTSCSSSKAHLVCAICECTVCKTCAQIADEVVVPLLEPMPAYFSAGVFCPNCFDQRIAAEIEAYKETAERAGQVNVFYKSESKESRFVRRIEKPIRVKDCVDRDLAVLKLAYRAAVLGFNILLDVELSSEKVRNGGWQTSIWQAHGIPGHVDEAKLNRRFVGAPN